MKQSEAHPPPLVALRQHDDDRRFLLQDHLPEVVAGLGQRTLSGDVLFTVFVSLKTQTTTFGVTQQDSHEVRIQQNFVVKVFIVLGLEEELSSSTELTTKQQ